MESRPTRNGDALRDYRISQVEKAVAGHEERLRVLEDFVIKQNSGGQISYRTILGALAVLGGVVLGLAQILRIHL